MPKKIFIVIAFFLIVLAGFSVRVFNLTNWLDNKDRLFFDNHSIPLMLTVDSYYYLELARQLQEGTYRDFDKRRNVPNGYAQPSTPPLLSFMLATLSRFASVPMEWVALLLPAFLGVLLAIPVYLLSTALFLKSGLVFAGRFSTKDYAKIAGLTAACAALLSPMFVGRSSVGWCDTDALNVVFPVLLIYFTVKMENSTSWKDLSVNGAVFILLSILFLWWWDQSHLPVFAFIFIPYLVALLFILRQSTNKILLFSSLGLILIIAVGIWKGFGLLNPVHYFETLSGMAQYIVSDPGFSPFRAAGKSVSEQSGASLELIIQQSSGWWPGFLLACCGLLLLAWRIKGYFLYLLPLLIVSFLSLKGQRFLIFTAPLFGLGIGALCFQICYLIKKPVWLIPVLVALLTITCLGPAEVIAEYAKRVPRRSPVLFEAMQLLNEKTEKNAVIWASWGHGHPLIYYSQRATVADGIFHSAELQYVLYFPLASSNFRLSANWISFYVASGGEGLRKANELFANNRQDYAVGMERLQDLLGSGVNNSRLLLQKKYGFSNANTETILQWLFPVNSKPVYLFLDYLLLEQAWFTLGRWDLESRSAPRRYVFIPVQNVTMHSDGNISGVSKRGNVTADVKKGVFQTGKESMPLRALKVHDGKKLRSRKYHNSSLLYAEFFLPGKIGVLAEQRTANTILTKLYYEYTYNRRFFTPIDVGNPYYGIWKIDGEQYQ